jgi:tetratricopeptide (TPR) repeat protein
MTAVLADAPRAALWGPSPVVQASGRCLDVVRILRMTPGNRHVEAVALRCQAVLEAMRGRIDAAREVLADARANLEELGLAVDLQETAVHAAQVELLAGDAAAAERLLRRAMDGFIALGLTAAAGQAAALLARALVEQGRDEEALQRTRFAEVHAGEDLKTTITWCGARAQALVGMGKQREALVLAQRAVELADPTDALADKADAALSLASTLRLADRDGDAREAEADARRLYEMKGHSVGVARLLALGSSRPGADTTSPHTTEADGPPAPSANLGSRAPERHAAELARRVATHHAHSCAELYAEDWVSIDHRSSSREPLRGRAAAARLMSSVFDLAKDVRIEFDEVLACDERVIALHMTWRGDAPDLGGEMAVSAGCVNIVEEQLCVRTELYAVDEREAMLARYAELRRPPTTLGDLPPERFWAEYASRFDAHDLTHLLELYAEDFVLVDHRPLGWVERRGRAATEETLRSFFEGVPDYRVEFNEVLACDERVIALRMTWRGHSRDGGGELALLYAAVVVVEDGLATSVDLYEHDDREGMLERFEELSPGGDRQA